MRRGGLLLAAALLLGPAGPAGAAEAPLVLEAKIPLGEVGGRIDHLAYDAKRQRLLVAELGNDSLGIVDLAAGKTLRTVGGLREPQGVGYEPESDSIYVANAGDGSVRILAGEDGAALGRIELGDDADNVRIDPARKQVLVGYGTGAIAVVDAATRRKEAEYRLRGHPEGFQLDPAGARIFVNVPQPGEVAIVDLAGGGIRSSPAGGLRGNFPMAADPETGRMLVVFRNPPTFLALDGADGRAVAKTETCGDADDVFVDAKRRRIYVVCGAGAVDVFEPQGETYARIARVPTLAGARTGLFAPALDRLFVAARAASGEPAAIWVYRPTP